MTKVMALVLSVFLVSCSSTQNSVRSPASIDQAATLKFKMGPVFEIENIDKAVDRKYWRMGYRSKKTISKSVQSIFSFLTPECLIWVVTPVKQKHLLIVKGNEVQGSVELTRFYDKQGEFSFMQARFKGDFKGNNLSVECHFDEDIQSIDEFSEAASEYVDIKAAE